MSYKYDQYIREHQDNVLKAFCWIEEKLQDTFNPFDVFLYEVRERILQRHDESKYNSDEYEAYDAYFYGKNRSFEVVQEFKRAWLKHIHRNPHHWQHWVLICDDPKEGDVVLEMPREFVLEMICDWWSFSWAKGDLYEIFNWYDERKDYIKFHKNTRKLVEDTLKRIKDALDE